MWKKSTHQGLSRAPLFDGRQGPAATNPGGDTLPSQQGLGKTAYRLASEEIDRLVADKSVGRYCLGYRDARGAFRVQFVGHSAEDLNAALQAYVGRYREFKFVIENGVTGNGNARHSS